MTLILALLVALDPPLPPSGETGVVRSLYQYVVAEHPLGIPPASAMRKIGPLFSSRVVSLLKTGRACEADYFRQQRAKADAGDGKPEFGWLELGLFSGGNENAIPAEFVVKESVPDSAVSWRVLVELKYFDSNGADPRNPYRWHVKAVVKVESGRFVIDDVIHEPDELDPSPWRLSETFEGCAGTKWVGYRRTK